MTTQRLTTKLVLNLTPLQQFGDHGNNSDTPVDVSPFAFIVLSDYSYAWQNCKDIVTLKPNTTLCWEVEVMGDDKSVWHVSGIRIAFKLIGCGVDKPRLFPEWKKIFNCQEKMFDPANGALEIQAEDFDLTPLSTQVLSASITTENKIKSPNNLSYSIYMNFSSGAGQAVKNYFFKIDPLIKNNSDEVWP